MMIATKLPTTTTMLPSAFLTLPSELIEAVLVSSSSPRTVAAVSQTCRALYALVYASPDSHLWRELFLEMWDDPRTALECRGRVDPRVLRGGLEWDWGVEYRRRVEGERWLKVWRQDICTAESVDEDDGGGKAVVGRANPDTATWDSEDVPSAWYSTTLAALRALLSTLLTLQPFPASPPIALTVISPVISPHPTGNQGSGVGDRRERMSNAPPLPPLLIVLASQFGGFESSRSAVRVSRVIFGPHATVLPGIGQVEPSGINANLTSMLTPTPSLPPQLVRTLLASRVIGVRGFPAYVPFMSGAQQWGKDPLGDVFHRIVCITGFAPIPPPLLPGPTLIPMSTPTSTLGSRPTFTSTPGVNSTSESTAANILEVQGDMLGSDPRQPSNASSRVRHDPEFPTPSEQHADARVLARRRVYDMRYLRADRLWGPYHAVTKETLEGGSPASGRDRSVIFQLGNKKRDGEGGRTGSSRGAATVAWLSITLDGVDSASEDTEDEDWHEPSTDSSVAPSSSSGSRENEPEEVVGDQDEAEVDGDEMETDSETAVVAAEIAEPPPTVDSVSTQPRSSRRRTRRSNPRRPPSSVSPRQIKPYHLRPDYTYLASVRIVVEANLRELFESAISDDVESAPEIQPGDVGMFWEDEEVLRVRDGAFDPVSSPRASTSASTTPMGDPGAHNASATFELADILSLFRNLEVARLGSACGFWGGWIERQRSVMADVNVDMSAISSMNESIGSRGPRIVEERADLEQPQRTYASGDKGKGKAGVGHTAIGLGGLGDWEIGPEDEACEGWDWAGVAGIWRRCVCWMDYRELLFFNLDSTKFLTRGTHEACRVIPMELHITGYSRASLMPVYDVEPEHEIIYGRPSDRNHRESVLKGYFRPPPVIHFSGSAVGSDRSLEDGRTAKGRVQLIGGGEVRWQMETWTQESNLSGASAPEWSSEAVQVGGIGSAVGVLGMWTGASHERADPLGPFWAWKVA